MATRAIHQLGLGTAQFGLDYGLTSTGAPVDAADVAAILAQANRASMSVIDTAAGYGTSEVVIGRALSNVPAASARDFRIISKLPSLRQAKSAAEKCDLAQRSFDASLQRLGRPSIYGLMLHDAGDLANSSIDAVIEQMQAWRASGRVARIGVSVYDAHDIEMALRQTELDLVQVPISIFDQRLLVGGQLVELGKRGFEVHARSILLQGLVLMRHDEAPAHLAAIRPHLQHYRAVISGLDLSPLAAALGFIRSQPEIDHAIIGVHTPRHLHECLAAYDTSCRIDFSALALNDVELIDPRRWRPVR